jgi:hypothetical protein
MQKPARFRSLLALISVWFTIFGVIFLAANYAAYIYLRPSTSAADVVFTRNEVDVRTADARATFERYGLGYFQRVYPGKSEAEILQLIRDQAQVGAVYEPYAEFRPSPYISPTLNIHSAGFRLIGPDQGPWPIDKSAFNIFVFGGSMALGAAVADQDAIPAVMQAILRARTGKPNLYVYNLGAGSHFSSQEVTYLQNKLRDGIVPDIVVFIDGQNDFYFWDGETQESPAFRAFVASGSIVGSGYFSFKELPLFRLARKLRAHGLGFAALAAEAKEIDRLAPTPDPIYEAQYRDPPEIMDPDRIQQVIGRYLANKKIAEGIASAFHIQPYFVWQPSPLYKYDLREHSKGIPDAHRRARYGYPAMAAYVHSHAMGDDFDWCADIQENVHKPLYADIMHYNPEGNRLVADCIVSGLLQSGVFERTAVLAR